MSKSCFPPAFIIADIVGIAVLAAVITSSPGFRSNVFNEIRIASVPLPTAIPYLPYFFNKIFSNLVDHQKNVSFIDGLSICLSKLFYIYDTFYMTRS